MRNLRRAWLMSLPFAVSALVCGSGSEEEVSATSQWAAQLLEAHASRAKPSPGQLVYALDDAQRLVINYLPLASRNQPPGLSLGDMRLDEARAAHGLLREVLSAEGYLRVQTIRELDSILHELEGGNAMRDPSLYTLQLFGEPGGGEWAMKLEGHHLSINALSRGAELRATPLFLGSNPAEVRSGPFAGLRVLGEQEDLGRELLASLTEAQRDQAVLAKMANPGLIPVGKVSAPKQPSGILASKLSADQYELMLELIDSLARQLRVDFAEAEMARVRAIPRDKLRFSWRGSQVAGEAYSFVISGPRVFVQLDAIVDRPSEGANHVHALWSDPERDFGADWVPRDNAKD